MTDHKLYIAKDVSNRNLNAFLRETMKSTLDGIHAEPNWFLPKDVDWDEEVRTWRGRRTWHFGIHQGIVRDTSVATYDAKDNILHVAFPADYKHWETADPYTRLRVVLRDRITWRGLERGLLARTENHARPSKI